MTLIFDTSLRDDLMALLGFLRIWVQEKHFQALGSKANGPEATVLGIPQPDLQDEILAGEVVRKSLEWDDQPCFPEGISDQGDTEPSVHDFQWRGHAIQRELLPKVDLRAGNPFCNSKLPSISGEKLDKKAIKAPPDRSVETWWQRV
ncbi:MAG: hypothetical protein M1830_004479 [Pleopsidium flavum]|nr:MAG: hypothetical protein M1830_004479 [Pleopsidium flavum]